MAWKLRSSYNSGGEIWTDTDSKRRIDIWKSGDEWCIVGGYDEIKGDTFFEIQRFDEKAAAIVVFHDYITDNP